LKNLSQDQGFKGKFVAKWKYYIFVESLQFWKPFAFAPAKKIKTYYFAFIF